MNFLEGIEFNIVQPVGVNVVAFSIKFTKKEQWKNLPLCMLEKLEYIETAVDGRIQKTFSIPYDATDDTKNVLIASFAKNRCVIGYGQVVDNKFVSASETIQLEYMNYAESEVQARNITFTYNPKRQMVLLDTETGEQILPIISPPDMFGNLKGSYKLIPYKKYIVLEMSVTVKLPRTEESSKLADVML